MSFLLLSGTHIFHLSDLWQFTRTQTDRQTYTNANVKWLIFSFGCNKKKYMCCDVAQVKETIWYTIKASINFPYQKKNLWKGKVYRRTYSLNGNGFSLISQKVLARESEAMEMKTKKKNTFSRERKNGMRVRNVTGTFYDRIKHASRRWNSHSS